MASMQLERFGTENREAAALNIHTPFRMAQRSAELTGDELEYTIFHLEQRPSSVMTGRIDVMLLPQMNPGGVSFKRFMGKCEPDDLDHIDPTFLTL